MIGHLAAHELCILLSSYALLVKRYHNALQERTPGILQLLIWEIGGYELSLVYKIKAVIS